MTGPLTLPFHRRLARTTLGCVLGTGLAAWAAGWFTSPQLVLVGFESEGSGASLRRSFATRGEILVRRADWRPITITATASTAAGPTTLARVAIDAAGAERRIVAVAERTPLEARLVRRRGIGPTDAIALAVVEGSGPVILQDVAARYVPTWEAWMTLAYGGLVGAWLSHAWRRRRGEAATAAPAHIAFTGPVAGVCLAALGLSVSVLRKPDALFASQLWAEDGVVFFRDAWMLGWDAIVLPYAGYLHLLPRLIAGLAVHLPPAHVPLAFTLGALVPVLLVGSLLASRRLPLTPAERVGCMLLAALPPVPGEVLLNLTNLHWMLALVFVLLLLARPPVGALGALADLAVLAGAGLTGPFSLAFAPLFVGRSIQRPSRPAVASAGVVTVTAAVQAVVLSASGRFASGEARPVDVVIANVGTRAAALLQLAVTEDTGFLVACGLAATVALLLVTLALERAWPAALCIGCSLLLFATVVLGMRGVPGGLAAGGERYFSLPVTLLLWGALLGRRRYPRLGTSITAIALVLAAPLLVVPPLQDLRWRETSACLDQGGGCTIPINPAGWSIDLPPGR